MRFALLVFMALPIPAANYPDMREDDYVTRGFKLHSGGTLDEVRIHFTSIGKPQKDASGVVRNAVLVLHGTGGTGRQFLDREFFHGQLFGPGQPLDASKYFLVLPDNLGHGKSTKPSDGLRVQFPRYGYRDMVELQRKLLSEKLGVERLRLIIGTSMGCMHAWVWMTEHPSAVDAAMPLACLPHPITGRNLVWRRMLVESIRSDQAYNGGYYTAPPPAMNFARDLMTIMASNPQQLQKRGATRPEAEKLYGELTKSRTLGDANDLIWQVESSWDYDPSPKLEQIRARVHAINFADDPINPPELGIFERQLKRVPKARFETMRGTPDTFGHGNHTHAELWKQHLVRLLK